MTDVKLPPLPTPTHEGDWPIDRRWNSGAMYDYGRQCYAAGRAAEALAARDAAAEPVAWLDPADIETLRADGWCVVHAYQSDPASDHAASIQLVRQNAAPVAAEPRHRLHETDIYEFAGWLTTRPGTMPVGSTSDATPMADAVKEYIDTHHEKFAAPVTAEPAIPADMDAMVNRFLSWRLPRAFYPDGGVRMDHDTPPEHWPTGTNLLTAEQARAMLTHVIAAAPPAQGGRR